MRYLHAIVLALTAAAGGLAACSGLSFDAEQDPYGTSSGYGGGYGGDFPSGGAAAGPNESPPFTYAANCGEGCVPKTGMLNECLAGNNGGAGGAGGAGGGSTGTTGGAGGSGGGGVDLPEGDCKLSVDDLGLVSGECSETNVGVEPGDSCLNSTQCGPGQACVDVGKNRACLPYCCDDVEACPTMPKQYCALRPMADDDVPPAVMTPPMIPVCVGAEDCRLLEDSCNDPMETCTIVRNDGTVSCVLPGDGLDGEECPCDEGYFCKTETNTCLKLCRTEGTNDDCPENESCQGGSQGFPLGFGACAPPF